MESVRGSLTNAAEGTRVQDMKIFATSHGLCLSVHEEKRTGGTSCPELQAQLHAQDTQGQTCPGEKQQDFSFVSEIAVWATPRYDYPSVCPVSAALLYLTQVPLRKHLSGSMYLQPAFDVPEAQVSA